MHRAKSAFRPTRNRRDVLAEDLASTVERKLRPIRQLIGSSNALRNGVWPVGDSPDPADGAPST